MAFQKRYRIWEFSPRQYLVQYTSPVYTFFTRKVKGEEWKDYGKWNDTIGFYPEVYGTMERAEDSLKLLMERDQFIPHTIKEYS